MQNNRSVFFKCLRDNNLNLYNRKIKTPAYLDLNTFFPNIFIGNLEITKQEDFNVITVILTYNVINTNINDTLEIDFV